MSSQKPTINNVHGASAMCACSAQNGVLHVYYTCSVVDVHI